MSNSNTFLNNYSLLSYYTMATLNNLGQEELSELRNSIGNLESTILTIYSNRKPRDLMGDEGILVRTLGKNYQGPNQFEPQYFDERREKSVDTEYAEVAEALEIYDKNPTRDNEIELLLEVGDIIFQKEIVELKHKDNENYVEVMKQFNVALDYITEELNKRDLSFDKAKQLVGVKYGSRAWLGANGYKPKDKGLEKQLCIEVYDA